MDVISNPFGLSSSIFIFERRGCQSFVETSVTRFTYALEALEVTYPDIFSVFSAAVSTASTCLYAAYK